MRRIRAFIVEDEPLAFARLRRLLKQHDEIEIVGSAADGDEALERIPAADPDLLFLDIQLPGLGGFDVLKEIGGQARPFVIFTTAYDQYAVKAFEVHALDYLLKPFDEERLKAALDRALPLIRGAKPSSRFIVKSGGRILFLCAEDVTWIAAADNYVYLHVNGASHLVRTTLRALAQTLDRKRFVRVHRSAIVNVDAIARIEPLAHGDASLVLRDGTRLTASRTYRNRLPVRP
jgi:two-component system LytT family response regulator